VNRFVLVGALVVTSACATATIDGAAPPPSNVDAGNPCPYGCKDVVVESAAPVEAGSEDAATADEAPADCDACPASATCIDGACVCASGSTLCNDDCIDTTTNDANCGACGNACTGSAQCIASVCATEPTRSIVFVSSQVYAAGALGGLAGADATCQSLAAAASLGTSSTFKAWLSDANQDATSRFGHWTTPYVLADLSTQVASDWTSLTSGALVHAIDMTETGGAPPTGTMPAAATWTNTTTSGGTYSKIDCSNWTSKTATVSLFHVGTATAATSAWTLDPSHSYTGNFCNDTAAIYCVGQ
jgi:hypothetical protein